MKVFIINREPHPTRFDELDAGDCFHYDSTRCNENFIGMATNTEGLCVNLSDGTSEYLYDDDLVYRVEVKIVNEV